MAVHMQITYPASVDFPGGTAPTLTASGVDQFVFTTRNGGTTYFGFVAGLDIKIGLRNKDG
jgi:hypothetical protein